MTKPFTIHVPMRRAKGMLEKMNAFYEGVLGYERDSELNILRVPGHRDLAVCFKYFDSTGSKNESDKGALYEFSIEKNFPSFCKGLRERGVEFDMLARTPGFYFARIFDPSGNSIEILSESFEDDLDASVSDWDIYQDIG
ncbi:MULTISPECIES: VOC family protein [unclassified Variovorax]|jgi:catechol 2,3-dioxygenase-like lactoylglutathione lyase family enzyme|uniref:VOC family protein n=1 Tax=unclassified Variovorax TaxID=663243 RepID=UPI000F7DFC86|nr:MULTISPECIES: VOC family protein [unclassified Variovorax]RSZ29327.1 VOC family protein [Variovorax sp. 553]RSZ29557.1 VOC family protein [Variovorax sp. 679]